MPTRHAQTAILVYALSLTSQVFGKLVNVTLDDAFVGPDQFGASITYNGLVGTGDNRWRNSTPSNPCTSCIMQPDQTKVFNGTWHTATIDQAVNKSEPSLEMTLSFSGVAVYVYGVIYHSPNTVLQTYVQFQLNNETAQILNITNGVPKTTTYSYRQAFFAQDGLPDGPHVLTATIPAQPGIAAEMILDYVVYTRNDGSNHHSSKVGAIVGGVVGAVVGLCIVAAIFLCWHYRRKRRVGRTTSLDMLQDSDSEYNLQQPPSPQMRQSPYPFPVPDPQDDHNMPPTTPVSTEPPLSVYSGAVSHDPPTQVRSDSSMPPSLSVHTGAVSHDSQQRPTSTMPPSLSVYSGGVSHDSQQRQPSSSMSPLSAYSGDRNSSIPPDLSQMLISEVAQLRAEVHALRNETPPNYDVDEVAHSGLPYLTG